eukprot:3856576-Prymnesium_polylepis.1
MTNYELIAVTHARCGGVARLLPRFAAFAAGALTELAVTRRSPPVTRGYSLRAGRLWRLESCHWMQDGPPGGPS